LLVALIDGLIDIQRVLPLVVCVDLDADQSDHSFSVVAGVFIVTTLRWPQQDDARQK
jgi:hypothetical protein